MPELHNDDVIPVQDTASGTATISDVIMTESTNHSRAFLAPELLSRDDDVSTRRLPRALTPAADTYAFAFILAEIATRSSPCMVRHL